MKNEGYIAFTSLLIVSAVSLAVVASVSLLGINESRNSLDYKKSVEVRKIAAGCAEEALVRIKNNSSYSGGSLIVGNGECSINVSGDSTNKTVSVTAQINSVTNYVSSLEVVVRRSGGAIVVTQWNQM